MSNADLSLGMMNDQVRALQASLQKRGSYIPANETRRGFFGPATRQAVLLFQQSKALPMTGVADQRTIAALDIQGTATSIAERAAVATPPRPPMMAMPVGVPQISADVVRIGTPSHTGARVAMELDRILPIKKAAQRRLLAIPGVHAVGIGLKIVAGQRTSEPSIMVFVVKKKPISALAPEEVIPTEIDGIKTDVFESEIPRPLAADDSRYRPLVGGIQTTPGGLTPDMVTPTNVFPGGGLGLVGTLGCIANTGGTNPKIVAITCQHVVGISSRGAPTNLTPPTVTIPQITFGGTNTAGSLVVTSLSVGTDDFNVFYVTLGTDTPATIATAVAAKITGLGISGLSATASGAQVTLSAMPGLSKLQCKTFGAHAKNTWADVQASITGNVISVSRQASNPCNAYVNLNIGGKLPTYGVLVPIAAGANASTVAQSIAQAIVARGLSGVAAVEMDPPAPGQPATVSVTVSGQPVQEIECNVSNDVRIGQPTNTFCSKCCSCCDDRIGIVLDAHLDLDVALIQLDPDLQYRAEIQDLGVVKGVHDITTEASGYPLKKRGVTTLVTNGTLLAVEQDGDDQYADTQNTPPAWRLFHRHYTGAFSIQGANFSEGGDSGAAVVNNNNEVVGIVFGGSSTTTVATPIQQILSAFPALNLSIETAANPGVVKTVPALAANTKVPQEAGENVADTSARPLLQRLREAEHEIAATPEGQRYRALMQRHFAEVQTLISTNRRVATVWHRSGGSQIVQGVLRAVQCSGQRIPSEINGEPLGHCLAKIQSAFSRYGSEALSADLREYGPPLARLAGLTYAEALTASGASKVTLNGW